MTGGGDCWGKDDAPVVVQETNFFYSLVLIINS